MKDYILFMHNDGTSGGEDTSLWGTYLAGLKQAGVFEGGSSIGDGACVNKSGRAPAVTAHLSGYIRIQARDLDHARQFVAGNPVFEAGGTVEIRELPRD